jgi:ferric-dicitrate binding protein FerR (iron transport regulator)
MNIPEILYKFASRTAGPEEITAFDAYLQTLTEKEYGQLLDDYGNIIAGLENAGEPDKALFAEIQAEIKVRKQVSKEAQGKRILPVVFKNSRRWYFAAAAIFMVMLIGIYTVKTTGKAAPGIQASTIITGAPGTNKAVLTLANGKQVILDNAANGNIATEAGATIIKLDKGLVAYRDSAHQSNEISYNTITTPRGGQYQLILPDGSHAWLNAASSLRFPAVFDGPERKVELTGEGYFEVMHDAAHPFIVSFNNTEVKVLGTEFNIMAYDDEAATQTTLVRGSIRLSKGDRQTLLQPGNMAVATNQGVKVQEADIEQATAWKNGMLSLENADLATVLRQVSRWYDVNIHYQTNVPEKRFFGLINRNVNLSTILEFLQKNDVHIKQEGRDLIVLP